MRLNIYGRGNQSDSDLLTTAWADPEPLLLARNYFPEQQSNRLAAEERILEFRSDVVVEPSGALIVTETITVMATGREIKRGIIRDFPTSYEGRYGQRVNVGFEVLEVRRGGSPEPFGTERHGNGVRVYIGHKDVFIPHGEHVYTLVYRTDRQLGFFEDFDELYWNVTGSDWSFPIERALATVTLPEGAEVRNWSAYTCRAGERGRDFETAYEPSGAAIALATTRRLEPGEGFTIAIAFPTGFVAVPKEIAELRRTRERERKEQAAARTLYDAFTNKNRIAAWPSLRELNVNPFVYEGQIVGLRTRFRTMISKNEGLFGHYPDRLVRVSNTPKGQFVEEVDVLLAAKVIGKESTTVPPGGELLIPHVGFIGVYVCKKKFNCAEILCWRDDISCRG